MVPIWIAGNKIAASRPHLAYWAFEKEGVPVRKGPKGSRSPQIAR